MCYCALVGPVTSLARIANVASERIADRRDRAPRQHRLGRRYADPCRVPPQREANSAGRGRSELHRKRGSPSTIGVRWTQRHPSSSEPPARIDAEGLMDRPGARLTRRMPPRSTTWAKAATCGFARLGLIFRAARRGAEWRAGVARASPRLSCSDRPRGVSMAAGRMR